MAYAASSQDFSRLSPAARNRQAGAQQIGRFVVGFNVFLGAFVFSEPAPYELMLLPTIFVAFLFGMLVPKHALPMLTLLVLFLIGGLMGAFQGSDLFDSGMYVATTGFLCLSAFFFACYGAVDTVARLRVIASGFILSAVVTALVGILAYFDVAGMAESFTLFGRARGTFEDPNVFGPYLVVAMALCTYGLIARPIYKQPHVIAALGIIMLALLLSFSRAAWGNALGVLALIAFMTFVTHRDPRIRAKLMIGVIVAVAVLALFLAAALSVPEIADLFRERASLSKSYDSGPMGRFARHGLGAVMMLDHPLGLGPFEFAKIFTEDPHNVYLNAAVIYGWLGFFAYTALVVMTLWKLFASIPAAPHLQRFSIPVFACFLIVCLQGFVIDTNHWRHWYLLLGLSWALIIAAKAHAGAHTRKAA